MSVGLSQSARNLLRSITDLDPENHSPDFISWRLEVFTRSAQNLIPAERTIVGIQIAEKRKELLAQ